MGGEDRTSHDQNFKNLILDYPGPALELFAAGEAEGIEGARFTPVRQEQLKERLGDRFEELDVPLLVEWPDGRREAVLFAVEEWTEPRRFSVHRMARYCLHLAELFDTDRVVPVAVFLRPGRYREALELRGDRGSYLSFRFLSCDLGRLEASRYLRSGNVVARLNLPNMRHDRERRVEVYAMAQEGLAELEKDPEKRLKYAQFVDRYAALSEEELARYRDEYLAASPRKEEIMGMFLKAAEEGRREGRQEGRKEGRQEGRTEGVQQGEALILERQMRKRFGEPPPGVRERLERAGREELELWAERILDARTLEEVFGE